MIVYPAKETLFYLLMLLSIDKYAPDKKWFHSLLFSTHAHNNISLESRSKNMTTSCDVPPTLVYCRWILRFHHIIRWNIFTTFTIYVMAYNQRWAIKPLFLIAAIKHWLSTILWWMHKNYSLQDKKWIFNHYPKLHYVNLSVSIYH